MSYVIDGPVTLGDTSTSTTIKGNISVPDTSSHTGDIFYTSNASGAVAALQHTAGGILFSDAASSLPTWFAPGALGQILVSGGAATNSAWLTQGSSGQVLTSNGAGANPTWSTSAGEQGAYGFSANYANATAQTSTQSSTSAGTVTQSGFVVTGTGTAFTTAMIGGQIVYGGSTFTVTGFSSATNISVFPANTQASGVAYTLTWGVPVVLSSWDTGTAPFYDSTSGGFVAATGIFTNSNAIGKYILNCQVTYTDTVNSGYRVLQVLRNTTVVFQTIVQANSTLTIPRTIETGGAMKLANTDTIKIQFANNSTGTSTVVASTAADGTGSTIWSMVLQAVS
jgi:hypothetical protein